MNEKGEKGKGLEKMNMNLFENLYKTEYFLVCYFGSKVVRCSNLNSKIEQFKKKRKKRKTKRNKLT